MLSAVPWYREVALMLQALADMGATRTVLYVRGEDRPRRSRCEPQVARSASRAMRSPNQLEKIQARFWPKHELLCRFDPDLYSVSCSRAPLRGTSTRVRAQLTRVAKASTKRSFRGHVTKKGRSRPARARAHGRQSAVLEGDTNSSSRIISGARTVWPLRERVGVLQ